VKKPVFNLKYENVDITADIVSKVKSVTYTDRQHGFSDDVKITLIDDQNLWRSDLFPKAGDKMELSIGYENGDLLNCGIFEVDSVEFDLFEPIVSLNGVSTTIKSPLKENVVAAFTEKTLKQIIAEIAKKHKLKVVGTIADIKFHRKTQNTSDLEFLRSLADDYGYIFKIVADSLVFTPYKQLEDEKPALTLSGAELLDGSRITPNINPLYAACEVSYFRRGKLYTATAKDKNIKSGKVLRVKERCENRDQAEAMAVAQLWKTNRDYITGSIIIEGNPLICAGTNLELKDVHKLSGIYQAKETRHTISGKDAAYITETEVYRVAG